MMKKIFCILIAAVLFVGASGCSDFLSGPKLDEDPNRAVNVPLENLFVGVQVSMYGVMEAHLNRTVMMWMQQMAGVAQHYTGYDIYNQTPVQFADQWFDIYGGGGLVDMRFIEKKGTQQGRRTLVGITKMWEALVMSTAADLWGDVPYSEAANPDIPFPKYDKQSEVHNAVLKLIDSAIEDLTVGQPFFDGKWDFTFGGDKDKWIAAAHTLKARILLNWAEVDPSNYQKALAEAQLGIKDESGNWETRHSDIAGEESIWWQFEARRFGYVRAGNYLVELLKKHNDPRLQIYFAPDAQGNYIGSKPGEFYGDASALNPNTYGAKDWDMELVTWYENQFIIAECLYNLGDEAGARDVLNNVIQPGIEEKWGLPANSLPRYPNLTGVDLLEAIMLEKYKALFLNMQIWSDWRRTAFPIFEHVPEGKRIPRRLLYSADELNTNPNTPRYDDPLYHRVENDPGNPSYPGRVVNP